MGMQRQTGARLLLIMLTLQKTFKPQRENDFLCISKWLLWCGGEQTTEVGRPLKSTQVRDQVFGASREDGAVTLCPSTRSLPLLTEVRYSLPWVAIAPYYTSFGQIPIIFRKLLLDLSSLDFAKDRMQLSDSHNLLYLIQSCLETIRVSLPPFQE